MKREIIVNGIAYDYISKEVIAYVNKLEREKNKLIDTLRIIKEDIASLKTLPLKAMVIHRINEVLLND